MAHHLRSSGASRPKVSVRRATTEPAERSGLSLGANGIVMPLAMSVEQTDALATELVRAGLVEAYTRHGGGIAYRNTALGTRVWRRLAMSDPIEGQAMLDALLADSATRPSTRRDGSS
jgi:hypothetical protein